MTTNAHYHPRGIDVDLADLPIWLYNEIASWRGLILPPPEPPVLTCLGNGEPMHVFRHASGRYFARHFSNGACGHSHSIAGMSDEHRRQAEYAARAAQTYGLQADLEVSTGGGTRVDVGITGGSTQVGVEIQRSELSRAHAKRRAKDSFDAGWPTVWIHDREKDPDWHSYVPTAHLTVRSIWEEKLPPSNTANVVIHKISPKRIKGGWDYEYGPTTVTLDELSYLMPAGEIEPVALRGGAVVLAHKGEKEFVDLALGPGASEWRPTTATPRKKEIYQTITRPCHHEAETVVVPPAEIEIEILEDALVDALPPDALDEWWTQDEPVVVDVIPLRQCGGCGRQQREPLRFSGKRSKWLCVHCWASDDLFVWGYDWSQRTWVYRKRGDWRV